MPSSLFSRCSPVIFLFAATLFSSATLMFVLQPMFGKILLPLLGGSPSVWNTCMVFYQSMLFLGYLYAHALSTRLQQPKQIQTHLAIVLISFIALPLALPENTLPPINSNPTFWLLKTLFLAIGLPFFVVSTTAPLMQKWFANIGHHTSNDPYYLYVASNTGSLVALLSYPFLIEPQIGLARQQYYWGIGYLFLCLMIGCCAIALRSSHRLHKFHEDSASKLDSKSRISIKEKFHWFCLAFVPSSLLLGLTNFISTDIASVPLLWIIPLTLYLLSFTLVFSIWNEKILPLIQTLQPIFLLPFITYAFVNPADLPYWAYLVLHLIAFFFAVMICHGELAKKRPGTEHLTTFYLTMSFAGMLGGVFNTLLAPYLFNGIYEYPIMIVASLFLRPGNTPTTVSSLLLQLSLPAVLVVIGLLLHATLSDLLSYFDLMLISLIILTGLSYLFRKKPVCYALLTGAIIFLALGAHGITSQTIFQQRSFFGVLAVRDAILTNEQGEPEHYHELFHGTTKHGAQRLAPNLSQIPLTYYSRPGPIGQLFKEYDAENKFWDVGVVGLGAGALTCYAKNTQHWFLYEIDPLVVDVASNTTYFSYLKQCTQNASIRIGDARISLLQEPDHKFDLLILDAFSSDSVPNHLLTTEALDLYFRKLKENGLLAFHMTNRHLSLKKVLSINAETLHLASLIQEFQPQQDIPLVVATDWVVMAKQPSTLEALRSSQLGNWKKMPLYFDMQPWTDDFTNIIGLWK